MSREMRRHGAHFDDIRICPHLPDGIVAAYRRACHCRKPAPGMLLDIMQHWPIERTRSVMIGDKESDLEAARAAGVSGTLYQGGPVSRPGDRIARLIPTAGRLDSYSTCPSSRADRGTRSCRRMLQSAHLWPGVLRHGPAGRSAPASPTGLRPPEPQAGSAQHCLLKLC